MTIINLLPWRARKRARRDRKILLYGVSVFSLAGLIFGSCMSHYQELISKQSAKNHHLESQLASLRGSLLQESNKTGLKKTVEAALKKLQQLQLQRGDTLTLLQTLAQLMPPDLYLTHLEKQQKKLILMGQAKSHTDLSLLLHQLEASPLLHKPLLIEMKQGATGPDSNSLPLRFHIQAEQVVR